MPLGGWFDEAIFSNLTRVEEGDVIFGNMSRVGKEAFYINTQSTKTNVKTDITVNKPRLVNQPWIYVTLESYADYDELDCDGFPTQKVHFTDIQLSGSSGAIQTNWTDIVKDNFCNTSISHTDNQVTIDF